MAFPSAPPSAARIQHGFRCHCTCCCEMAIDINSFLMKTMSIGHEKTIDIPLNVSCVCLLRESLVGICSNSLSSFKFPAMGSSMKAVASVLGSEQRHGPWGQYIATVLICLVAPRIIGRSCLCCCWFWWLCDG